MRFFPYKEIYIRTSLTKVEAHKVIREYSVEKVRINIPYMSIYDGEIYPQWYYAKAVNIHFEGYIEEVRGQTALYGKVESMIVSKVLFPMPAAILAIIMCAGSMPWYIIAVTALIVLGASFLIFIKSSIKENTPYFEKRFKEIFKKAEQEKEEIGEIDYKNISL